MASKTGWWPKGWQVDIREGTTKLYFGNAHGKRHRVCVRVDECPETMTRAELNKKKGWEVKATTVQVTGQEPQTRTHARPHPEAEWSEIVEDE